MKFGLRKPSLKKSLSARTKGRATRAVKKALIPGYGKKGTGFLKNPKKAAYNKVYRKTTFGVSDLVKGSQKSAKDNPHTSGPTPQPAGSAPGRPNRPKKPFTKRWYVWAIVIVVAVGAIGSLGQPQSVSTAHPAATAVSSLADAKDIDAAQNPGTASASSASSSADAVQTDTGQEGTSGPSAPDASTPSSGDPAAALPPAGTQTTETGDPTPQTAEPESEPQSEPTQEPEPDPEPAPEPAPEPEPNPGPSAVTVYITDTGSKYHRSGCRYLKDSQHEISLSSAKSKGYEPCKVCKPPTG